ncbi:MAG TPA: hypothetical protein DIW26_00310 [Ruminococcus sp.]|nr:hypothetical protein [Ruminococcus sp.]
MRKTIYASYKSEISDLLSYLNVDIDNLIEIDNTAPESSETTEINNEVSEPERENTSFFKYFALVIAVMGITVFIRCFYDRNSDTKIIPYNTESTFYSETSDISITSEYTDNVTETYISSEITVNTELSSADFTETYISSEITETSLETNEYEETGIKTSEIPIDEDNFFIKSFFPQDFVSKIEDKDVAYENGNRIINVSEFVVLDDEKNIKSINKKDIEIKFSKENIPKEWKCGDYSGDYIKNNDNIVLRTIYNSFVEIKFLIKGNNQVYMILD